MTHFGNLNGARGSHDVSQPPAKPSEGMAQEDEALQPKVSPIPTPSPLPVVSYTGPSTSADRARKPMLPKMLCCKCMGIALLWTGGQRAEEPLPRSSRRAGSTRLIRALSGCPWGTMGDCRPCSRPITPGPGSYDTCKGGGSPVFSVRPRRALPLHPSATPRQASSLHCCSFGRTQFRVRARRFLSLE
eukprot:s2476_g1.t2